MKRTAAALFLGTILALASCGSTDNEEGQGGVYAKFDGELERGAVLRILENDTAVKQGYLKELLDGFNEKYKEYGIVAVDANMDEYSDLENDGPYGYGPDVWFQANDILMKYATKQHLLPLPVQDMDVASPMPVAEARALLETHGVACREKGVFFGTLDIVMGAYAFEYASFRAEEYGAGGVALSTLISLIAIPVYMAIL